MIMMGLAVAAPTAVIILLFIRVLTRFIDIPMRPIEGAGPEPDPLPDEALPGLLVSLLPIVLPVLLISANTVAGTLAKAQDAGVVAQRVAAVTAVVGNANLAMLLSAAIALLVLKRQRHLGRRDLARIIESALMSGGVIILITSAGGAFGAMLQAAGIGDAIEGFFGTGAQAMGGSKLIVLAFLIAFLLKFAQGSSTVSMLTTSGIMVGLIPALGQPGVDPNMGFHPVYLATAIGFGAQCGNWMNDSGFWIFAKMGGLSVIGLLITLLYAALLPMA